MTITELILELEKHKNTFGDIEVKIETKQDYVSFNTFVYLIENESEPFVGLVPKTQLGESSD